MSAKLLTFAAYTDHNSIATPMLTGKVTQEKRDYITIDLNGSKSLVGVDTYLTLCEVKTALEDGVTIPTHLSPQTNFRKLTSDIWVISFHEPVEDEESDDL
jgi:hypothetical protein